MVTSSFPVKMGTMLSQGKDGVKGRASLLMREGAMGRGFLIATLFSLVLCRWAGDSSSDFGAGYVMSQWDESGFGQEQPGSMVSTALQGAVQKVAGRRTSTVCVVLVSSEGSEWKCFWSSINSYAKVTGSWIPFLDFWLTNHKSMVGLSKTNHFPHLYGLSLMKHTQGLPDMFFRDILSPPSPHGHSGKPTEGAAFPCDADEPCSWTSRSATWPHIEAGAASGSSGGPLTSLCLGSLSPAQLHADKLGSYEKHGTVGRLKAPNNFCWEHGFLFPAQLWGHEGSSQ